jgi:hypothetical protein
MDPQPEQQDVPQIRSVEEVARNIDTYCGKDEPVIFFQDPENLQLSPEDITAGNNIYDMMLYTLGEIGYSSLEEINKGGRAAGSYEKVLRTLEPLTHVCQSLAHDKLPLRRNVRQEERHREEGDEVYSYNTPSFELDGIRYNTARVFIRPRQYNRPLNPRTSEKRPQLRLSEKADPRMTITAIPEDSSVGEVSIRIDEEGFARGDYKDFMITFDVQVGNSSNNLVSQLNFSSIQGSDWGQRFSHHFSSSYTARDLNTSFDRLLNSFNTKIEKSLPTPDPTPPTE